MKTLITNRNTKYRVTYRGYQFDVLVDSAGLDIIAVGELTFKNKLYNHTAHELFCKVFDNDYATNGLVNSLLNAGVSSVKPMNR